MREGQGYEDAATVTEDESVATITPYFASSPPPVPWKTPTSDAPLTGTLLRIELIGPNMHEQVSYRACALYWAFLSPWAMAREIRVTVQAAEQAPEL